MDFFLNLTIGVQQLNRSMILIIDIKHYSTGEPDLKTMVDFYNALISVGRAFQNDGRCLFVCLSVCLL